jgi:hypothetical protein
MWRASYSITSSAREKHGRGRRVARLWGGGNGARSWLLAATTGIYQEYGGTLRPPFGLLLGDLQIARMLRGTSLAHVVRKGPKFRFQAEVLFARFGCPAHTGKTMVFRSHRPIFGCIDHSVLPRESHSPRAAGANGAGRSNGSKLSFGMEARTLCVGVSVEAVCIFAEIKSRGFSRATSAA